MERFRERARAGRPGADLPAEAVEEVCRHLDGLPLAVELAAARVRVLSVAEIARRLEDRFGLLRGGARDAPERHRTLQAVVDWSWNLLDPAGRAAMRALSVFPTGFTADAAGYVLGGGDAADVPGSWRAWSTSRCSRWPTPRPARASGCWRRCASSARRSGRRPGRPTGRSAGSWPGRATRGGAPRRGLRARPRGAAAADPGRAGQPGAGAPARPRPGGRRRRRGHLRRARGPVDHRVRLPAPGDARRRHRPAAVALPARARPGRAHPDEPGAVDLLHVPPPGAPCGALAGRPAPAAAGPAGHPGPGRRDVCGAAQDRSVLYELRDSDEPLVAGATNGVVSYFWENEGDLDSALKAARRTLDAFEQRKLPYMRAVTHARISELCLQAERGDEALRHLLAALPVLEQLGITRDLAGLRSWLVLANLQVGDVDEAEHWLEQTAPPHADEPVGAVTYGLGVRAEILLARRGRGRPAPVAASRRPAGQRRGPDLRPRGGPEPGDVAAGGQGRDRGRPRPAWPARPRRGPHRRAAGPAVEDAGQPRRQPAALPDGAAHLRRACWRWPWWTSTAERVPATSGPPGRGADGRPGRALPVPAQLPSHHVRRPRPRRGRAGRQAGVPRRGVVVRRPGRAGPAGRRPGRAGARPGG